MKAIDTRRSVRSYSNKEVSEKDIYKILNAAMQAPSARNQQPWEYLVIKDQNKKDLISENLKTMKMASGASFIIVYLVNKENILTPGMVPQDMGATITCSLIEARSLRIGSCWCGVYPNEERIEMVRKICKINKDNLEPFALVCFGYPEDETVFKKAKRNNKEKIHFEEI